MRPIRFILALFIGFSLTIAPVAAAMASPAISSGMAMEHCDKALAKTASAKTMASHCDCCDKANACRADSCGAQCIKINGFLPVAAKPACIGLCQDFPRPTAIGSATNSWPPPAPPPRV